MNDRRRGPSKMSPTELAAFLDAAPTGVVCAAGEDGLRAFPARLLDASGGQWELALPDCFDGVLGDGTACFVADTFTTYEGIRGIIVQGSVEQLASDMQVGSFALRPTRVRTFRF